jgi:hypothetical protein
VFKHGLLARIDENRQPGGAFFKGHDGAVLWVVRGGGFRKGGSLMLITSYYNHIGIEVE